MTDYTEFVLSMVESPLVAVVVGAIAAAILAYYVTVRLYRPQKVFETKQRLYPEIVRAIQEIRVAVPLFQRTMQQVPMPVNPKALADLNRDSSSGMSIEPLLPTIAFNYAVLEAVSRLDRAGETRSRVAELASDVRGAHTWELIFQLHGVFISAMVGPSQSLTSAMAELAMFERSKPLENLIGILDSEAKRLTAKTVSSGGREELDWTLFDSTLGALQMVIEKDIGRSSGLALKDLGITWSDLGVPAFARLRTEASEEDVPNQTEHLSE